MEPFLLARDPFIQWLLRASGEVSALIILILAIQWVFRNQLSPKWRYSLWFLVVVRMLMPALPESSLSLFNLNQYVWKSGLVDSLKSKTPSSLQSKASIPSHSPSTSRPIPSSVSVKTQSSAGESLTTFEKIRSLLSIRTIWFGIWACGALFLLLRILWENHRFSNRVVRQRLVTDTSLLNLVEDCKAEMRLHTPVSMIVSPQVTSPMLLGFVRPRLLLPENTVETFSLKEMRYIFLHELGHVKRNDIIINWLVTCLQVLHWFNPLVWFAFNQMRADREQACDALVLSYGKEKENFLYGETIIKLLRNFRAIGTAPSLVGILEDRNQMKIRMDLIGHFTKSARQKPALAISLLTCLAVICLTQAKNPEKEAIEALIPSTEEIKAGANLTEKILIKMDLSGKDLKGTLLTKAQLNKANLRQANLTSAFLKDADLSGADLTGAILEGATLHGANFKGAKLDNVKLTTATYDLDTKWPEGFEASAQGAILLMDNSNLSDKSLAGQNLTGAIFTNSKFKNANLSRTKLVRAFLKDADLTGAILTGATLETATLHGANFLGAHLENVNLTSAQYDLSTRWPDGFDPGEKGAILLMGSKDLSGQNLSGRNLAASVLGNCKLKNAVLNNANLRRAFLKMVDFSNADLTGANLEMANLQGVNFIGAKLEGASLINALYDLSTKWPEGYDGASHGALLMEDNRDLSGRDLSGKNLTGALFTSSKLTKAKLNKADLTRAFLIQADLSGADLSGASLVTASLQGANLKEANLTNTDFGFATYDEKTQWPEGFDPKSHGAILVKSNL